MSNVKINPWYIYLVCMSQRLWSASVTKPNHLKLYMETNAVYFQNYKEYLTQCVAKVIALSIKPEIVYINTYTLKG